MRPAAGQQPRRRRPADYEGVYDRTPRWDIGRPQPALLRVAEGRGLAGHVLDAGCGTGEHALMAAALGHTATGVDTSERAIQIAGDKARARGLQVRFSVCDATALTALGECFDTVVDSGLFHVLDDADRARYVEQLAAVVAPGGRYLSLCFSDREPGQDGPRRITRQEILDAFRQGWRVDSIDPATIDTVDAPASIAAWLTKLTRTGP